MDIVPLKVPYLEKDEAKARGAKWDFTKKYWYIRSDMDQSLFAKWLPTAQDSQPPQPSQKIITEIAGISLSQYLEKMSARYLK